MDTLKEERERKRERERRRERERDDALSEKELERGY